MHNEDRILNNRTFGSTQSLSPNGSWCFKICVWWTSLESPPSRVCIVLWWCPTNSLLECLPCVTLASSDIISASVLWDTAVCFLQAHEIGINVCDPNTEHHPKLTLSPSNFLQNRRLGKISLCSLSLASQRDWWDVLVADRTLNSFLSLIWSSNSMSEVNVAFQCLPSTSIFKPSESEILTILPQFPDFSKNGYRPNKMWKPSGVVNRLVRQFATAFNTLLTVTFHVIAPSWDVFGICLFGFDTILLWSCAARRVHPRYTVQTDLLFAILLHIFGMCLNFPCHHHVVNIHWQE